MRDLDVAACRRWVELALARLQTFVDVLDALNVYPVPDGDTGTNLLLTLRRAAQHAADCDPAEATIGSLSEALAVGALLGARGNSGIITAQVLRGCADTFAGSVERVDGTVLARALVRADQQAWQAVALPVEGTVLSATRAVAAALVDCTEPDAALVARTADDAARQALALTTAQLPDLAAAGVVDAGAAGFVLLLDALVAALSGEHVDEPAGLHTRPEQVPRAPVEPAYEVMFRFEVAESAGGDPAGPSAGDLLRSALSVVGESVVVAAGPAGWQAHVHTGDPSAAVAEGRALGSVSDLRMSRLDGAAPHADHDEAGLLGCVAWASGPGLAGLIVEAGGWPLIGGSAHRVCTEEVLAGILATGCTEVIVLPNDADSIPIVRAAVAEAAGHGVRARPVVTVAEVQGLAAMAVFDPVAGLDDAVAAMSTAADGVRHAALAIATRDARTAAGDCRAGDCLGIADGHIGWVTANLVEATGAVVTSMLARGGELVTVVLGVGAGADVEAAARAAAAAAGHHVQVQVVAGGQHTFPVLIGVE